VAVRSDSVTQPEEASQGPSNRNEEPIGRRLPWPFYLALLLLYLAAVLPRLRAAGFDEPDMTYNDEQRASSGQAAALLADPKGKITFLIKAPALPHFLVLAFKPWYWLVKDHFGWKSVKDVQWWRAWRYWRSLNTILGGLVVILIGVVGARAYNMRVGLLAAAFCAASRRCAMWFTYLKEEALATLCCTIVIYCACRILRERSGRVGWILLAGLASGSAVAFKYTGAPIVLFFLLVLVLAPRSAAKSERSPSNWFSRYRAVGILLYLAISAVSFVLWFPQLLFRTREVWQSVSEFRRFRILDVAAQHLPSLRECLSTAWYSWDILFRSWSSSDSYPMHFFILLTVIFAAAPIYALIRRERFLLALGLFCWVMFLSLYYQNLFTPIKVNHHFVPAITATFLVLAVVLDRLCERLSAPIVRRTAFSTRAVQPVLLVSLCLWPLAQSYAATLDLLAYIRGDDKARASRRDIIHSLPVGSRILMTRIWRQPHISDSLIENVYLRRLYYNLCADITWDDLVRQGFDYASLRHYNVDDPLGQAPYPGYNPDFPMTMPPYLAELVRRRTAPDFSWPDVSLWLDGFSYVPIRPDDGEYFHVSLYFREPSGGDYAGVRGVVPPAVLAGSGASTQPLILQARLSNAQQWFASYVRWEVLLDGKTLWHGRDTTDTQYVALTLPISARAGSEIQIRTLRTDYHQEATWNWGGNPTRLNIGGLKVIDPATSKPVALQWSYTGRNGGPGPAAYAQRTDWLHHPNPVPLLDMGFEGRQPLVEAWRPYQLVEPKDYRKFPKEVLCRKMACVEKAVGQGIGGSNALRFRVGHPPKESATLGVMQPIAYPASQRVQKLRVHYRRAGDERETRGEATLRLGVEAVSLSGASIDRAGIKTSLASASSEWNTLELNLGELWKAKHTRTDLIDFLEVTIETVAGAHAVLDCLVDNVELE